MIVARMIVARTMQDMIDVDRASQSASKAASSTQGERTMYNNLVLTVQGRLSRDAELKAMANGNWLVKWSIPWDRSYTKDGVKIERVVWLNCTCFSSPSRTEGQLSKAERYANKLKKGDLVSIVAFDIEPNAYTPQGGGETKVSLNVTVEECRVLKHAADALAVAQATADDPDEIS
jgi:single-stranded DNA-binding protein